MVAASTVCAAVRAVRVTRIQDAGVRRIPFQKKVGAGLAEYEDDTLNDSTSFGGGAGWRYGFSERSSFGFSLRADAFLYDEVLPEPGAPPPAIDTGATTAQLVGEHNFSEVTTLNYGAGATYTDSDLRTSTNFSGDVGYSVTLRRDRR